MLPLAREKPTILPLWPLDLEHRSTPSRLSLTLDPNVRLKFLLLTVIPPPVHHLIAWQKDSLDRRFAAVLRALHERALHQVGGAIAVKAEGAPPGLVARLLTIRNRRRQRKMIPPAPLRG